jgi:hypothetical protein
VRRPGTALAVAAAGVVALTGCSLFDHPEPPAPPVPTITTPAPVVPDELTSAVWGRKTDTMEVDIKILPDGRYRSVEIYSPVESGGIYQLRRVEDGVAQVSGERLRLVGRSATLTRTATDDPNGDYQRATPARTGTYEWHVAGNKLHLTDANGDDAIFTPAKG